MNDQLSDVDASRAGTFLLGGDLKVNRLGYGAMRITGEGTWGEPANPEECLATLRLLPELGVNLIDTADSYGPVVSEQMIKEALHPYPEGLVVATKGGQARPAPHKWVPLGRPEYLMQQVQMSMRFLGVEQIGLWQLHRIDEHVPRDEQFGAMKTMVDNGWVRHLGLSEVTVEEIEAAREFFPVAAVQNRYSVTYRKYEDVLDYCEANGIAFLPWRPLEAGHFVEGSSSISDVAKRHEATEFQVALAWLLKRSPVMLPIPGTSRRTHLRENVAAGAVELSDEEFEQLSALGE